MREGFCKCRHNFDVHLDGGICLQPDCDCRGFKRVVELKADLTAEADSTS